MNGTVSNTTTDPTSMQWFAMRDLRRANALRPAYRQLSEAGFDVFTPLRWTLTTTGSRTTRRQIPCIPDLLFVRSTRADLDPIVDRTPTLQYRYARGHRATPIIVRDADMFRFITAVRAAERPDTTRFYTPAEITPDMYGRRIRIIGGPLDAFEGHLLYVRGSRTRRLIVELPGYIIAAVEVAPQYIQLL